MSEAVMPAIVVQETGGAGDWNRLILGEAARPTIQNGEVLVQVEACSINRADLLQRRGLYSPPLGASEILGLDFAGYVVETATDVSGWHAGDRVFGIVAGGGYGRYVAVCAEHLLPVPDNLSFVEAAAAAEVFIVAFLTLFLEAGLELGERLLLHGGGSGVGTAAIQLARVADAEVIVTCGSAEKIQRALGLGAHHALNYRNESFVERVWEITRGLGVDVVLDWIGAPYLNQHLSILGTRGRLVMIGMLGGNKVEVQLAPLLTKRLRIVGSVLRSRSREEKTAVITAFRDRVLPLLQAGRIRPVVDRIFPIQDVEEAHQTMRDSRHFGKLVLTWQLPDF